LENQKRRNGWLSIWGSAGINRASFGSLVTLLKGRDSPKIVGGNSLDALVDVMGDWFIEHWGETIEIYIRGADAIKRCDPALLPLIADCMQSAFDSGARNAHLVGRDTPYEEAKKRVTIFFCWPGEAPRRNRVLSGSPETPEQAASRLSRLTGFHPSVRKRCCAALWAHSGL
jgi:hypothetical protein